MDSEGKWKEMVQASMDAREDLNYFADDVAIIWAANEIKRLQKLATQRGARMQILRRWLCLEACDGTEDSLDEVWQSFVWSNPDAEDWFDEDGAPRDD